MGNLLRAEWLKLTHRPLTWWLLLIFLLLVVLYFTLWFLLLAVLDGLFTVGGVTIQIDLPQVSETMLNQIRNELRFPGILGSVLGQLNSFGGICAIVLAAGALGSEYSWGTLRMQLARHPRRGHYLVAKLLALLLVLLAGMALTLLVGAGIGGLYAWLLGMPGSVGLWDLLLLPLGMLRALYVMLPYILFTLAVCVVGRSVLAGVAGGLVFLTFDAGASSLSFLATLDNPLLTFFYHLLLQPNIATLIAQNRAMYGSDLATVTGLDAVALPPPWQAMLVVGGYSALFFAYAYYGLVKRDIVGAS